jgi:hypothetical protein
MTEVHPVTDKGLTEFLGDITTILEEVRMSVVTGKEETGTGKTWIALVSYLLPWHGYELIRRSTLTPLISHYQPPIIHLLNYHISKLL